MCGGGGDGNPQCQSPPPPRIPTLKDKVAKFEGEKLENINETGIFSARQRRWEKVMHSSRMSTTHLEIVRASVSVTTTRCHSWGGGRSPALM